MDTIFFQVKVEEFSVSVPLPLIVSLSHIQTHSLSFTHTHTHTHKPLKTARKQNGKIKEEEPDSQLPREWPRLFRGDQ